MPNNNNDGGKRQKVKNELKRLFGDDLNQELRHLIDLAVRRQLTPQDVVERLVNTHYFRQKFPGLVEKNGSISNLLTGEQGVSVSIGSLGSAVKNYNTALESYGQQAQRYGYKFGRDQLATVIRSDTSLDEYTARLGAIETIDANPALEAAFNQQQRLAGYKVNKQSAYREALKSGPNGFMNTYQSAQFQSALGFSKDEARDLATKGGAVPAAATFDDVNQLVANVRENLQAYLPELQNEGINAAKLVKIFGNPAAFTAEMGKIKAIAQQRQQRYGNPVAGTYAQQGQSGGFSQYPNQREQGYG